MGGVVVQRHEIYSYDLVTRVETRITTTAEGEDWMPNISGNRIVWMNQGYGQNYRVVYAFNLATRGRDAGDRIWAQIQPGHRRNRVVYASYSPTPDDDIGTADLYMRTIL